MTNSNDTKKVKTLIRKMVHKLAEKQNQDESKNKVEVLPSRKNIAPHSRSTIDKREPIETDNERNFDLNRHEWELLTKEKSGLSKFFAKLTGDSPYETRTDTESIRETTENVRARRELREEIVRLVTQPIRAEETFLDAHIALQQKKLSMELEREKHELEKQKIDTEKVRLELERHRLRKEIEDLKNTKEPTLEREEKKEVNYDIKDFLELTEKNT